jgi:small subunit ribosomal protein S13
MVRISNVNIPDKKNVPYSLTYIYGIGQSRAKKIVNKLNIDSFKKAEKLTNDEIKKINEEIKDFPIEGELKRLKQEIINTGIRLGTYRGNQRRKRLPVNGQRTRHNARTCKGRLKKTVANKKKAPKH